MSPRPATMPRTEIITDYEVHGAARSDIGKALSVIERLDAAGWKPDTLFADGGYPSVPSALKINEQDIEFITPVNRSRLSDDIVGRDLFAFDPEGFATTCPMGHKPDRSSRPEREQQNRPFPPCDLRREPLPVVHDARSLSGAGSQPSRSGLSGPRYRRGLPSGDHPRASSAGSYVLPFSRPPNGRTATGSVQGSRQRTPS